jgi:chromosomal replication initiation ATPase DnaA|tara:strand:+ start:1878 stop:2246 length:369 start_codon:yes stop_codon:yes gene_type:complete
MNRSEKLIIEAVESATGVSDIIRKTRKREYVDARRIAYMIFRETQFYTFEKIGELFNRGHATVLFGIRSGQSLIDFDPEFKENYLQCLAKIGTINTEKEQIRQKILDLKRKLLTLEKIENGL